MGFVCSFVQVLLKPDFLRRWGCSDSEPKATSDATSEATPETCSWV